MQFKYPAKGFVCNFMAVLRIIPGVGKNGVRPLPPYRMTLKAKSEEFRRRLLKGGGKVLSEETPGPSPPLKDTPKSSQVLNFHRLIFYIFFNCPSKFFAAKVYSDAKILWNLACGDKPRIQIKRSQSTKAVF